MANDRDKIVKELFDVIQEKKAAIAKAEKPTWETNCAFRYGKESSNSTNIHVCSSVEELLEILTFLVTRKDAYDTAQKLLGTSIKFKWFGYTFGEWLADIKTRMDKIEISNKKKELEELEGRLDKLYEKL
jgi:hypothetical protein